MTTLLITLASHPFQILLAMTAIYHAGAHLLGRKVDRRARRNQAGRTIFRPAA